MTPAEMAALHFDAFIGQGRPWTEAEFAGLLESVHVFAVGDANAFALGRVVAGEAELLTIATDPRMRRRGLGRAALVAFEAEAAKRGAVRFFLEVAEDNAGARALYAVAGYAECGRRPGYYPARDGRVDAIAMEKPAG